MYGEHTCSWLSLNTRHIKYPVLTLSQNLLDAIIFSKQEQQEVVAFKFRLQIFIFLHFNSHALILVMFK